MGEDGDSDSDEEDEYDGCEETSLEAYTTPLDDDDCEVDEYNIFKQVRLMMISWTDIREGFKNPSHGICPLGGYPPTVGQDADILIW